MKLVHVVSHIDEEASGPGNSVPMLCDVLVRGGHQVTLATLARDAVLGTRLFRHDSYRPSFGPPRLGVSRDMRAGLARCARDADLVHNHGLWMMPNVYSAWAARSAGKSFVLSPRGTLSPVARARSRLVKDAFWSMLQARAVRCAAMLHATSHQEYLDIRAMGLTQPVAVIPNGIDLAALVERTAPSDRSRCLLYLGRIYPIKGLENLIEAWTTVAGRHPEWSLRIVGPGDEAYVASLKRLCAKLESPRVEFAGPLYGADKAAAYRAADLSVLPSFTENFGMSVAEALAHGLPVITTSGAPWAGVLEEDCGWWVEPNVAGLGSALSDAMNRDEQTLRRMGANGRDWMAHSFSWESIALQMEAVYRWLLSGGEPPPTVQID